ncbi:MAG: acyl-CoA desaturase [Thermoleophilia bacterium]|nr:acyl-CoA desaturase [Thermoleophilia bacterium]
MLLVTLGPLAALAIAMFLLWGHGLSGADVVAFVSLYCVSLLGVTVGYHRQLTHAGFESRAWVRNAWAMAGSLAVEGGPVDWVADHRRHHAHSDKEGDPHSPHLHEQDTFVGQLKGFWHAHAGWMIHKDHDSDPERWAPDMLRLPGIVRINRLFPLFIVLSLVVIPGAIGLALTGTWIGMFSAMLWGGPIRMMVGHHVTWSTNSICHVFGRRDFESDDLSTNNWALSLLSFGESWHNNHHAFPSSAVHGLRWWQVDLSALVIRAMEQLRLVRDVKVPSARAIERKRIARG